MKKNILFISLFLIFTACSQNKKNEINIAMKTSNNIPQDKQLNYIIDLTLKTPFELYVNDIKVIEESRGSNAAVDINPYILKNGKYKVKLKMFPFLQLKETNIDVENIKNSNLFLGNYVKDRKTNKTINYDAKIPLIIKAPNNNLPYFEQEWEIEIKDLPYEVEGWSKGQDLSIMDQKVLEEKVVNYYQKLWNILNNGNGEGYIKLWEKADRELESYDYESDINAINQEEINYIKKYCKGMMIPLEDYEMKLYADSKLVTLERKTHTTEFNNKKPVDLKGWSPLIRKAKLSGGDDYSVKLYLPQGGNDFVIIRK